MEPYQWSEWQRYGRDYEYRRCWEPEAGEYVYEWRCLLPVAAHEAPENIEDFSKLNLNDLESPGTAADYEMSSTQDRYLASQYLEGGRGSGGGRSHEHRSSRTEHQPAMTHQRREVRKKGKGKMVAGANILPDPSHQDRYPEQGTTCLNAEYQEAQSAYYPTGQSQGHIPGPEGALLMPQGTAFTESNDAAVVLRELGAEEQEKQEVYVELYDQEWAPEETPQGKLVGPQGYDKHNQQYEQQDEQQYEQQYDEAQFEEDLNEAKSQSLRTTLGKGIFQDPFGPIDEASASSSSGLYDPETNYERPDFEFAESGEQTPRARTPSQAYPQSDEPQEVIRGLSDKEELDSRYQFAPSSRFQPGEVFKVLWADPRGDGVVQTTEYTQLKNVYGELFYVSIRRFVIIATDEGNSTCVPILTYRKQGCAKPGVKPKVHGMIYGSNEKKPPKPPKDEPILGFPPVRMTIIASGEKLDKTSRVNYSKLVTVEHNLRVFFIGRLERHYFTMARDAADVCWNRKQRDPKNNRKHGRKH